MKRATNLLLILFISAMTFGTFTSCKEQKKEPDEKIEEGIDKIGEGLEDAEEDVKDAAEDVKEKVEETIDTIN